MPAASLLLHSMCMLAAVSAEFLPAASPQILWQGRTLALPDGSMAFDWQGTQASFTVNPGSSTWGIWVKMLANVTVEAAAKLSVFANGYNSANVHLHNSTSEYLLVANLQGPSHAVDIWQTIEPGNQVGVWGMVPPLGQRIQILGFETNGQFGPAPAPRARRMDIIGDSITAGSQYDRESSVCNDWQVTNSQAYNWESYLCRNFTANCTTVAWSGRGLQWNHGDPNRTLPTLPVLYNATFGSDPHSQVYPPWDFSRASVPDAVLINLGTNDFSNNINATEWSYFYASFLQSIVSLYSRSPPSPHALATSAGAGAGAHTGQGLGEGSASGGITFFLAVGPITDNYRNATLQAVSLAQAAGLNAHYLDLTGATLDGCGNHPGAYGHWDMFQKGRPQIAQVMGW